MSHYVSHSSIDAFMAVFGRFFYRKEGRELAKRYVTGLTLHGPRKSVEPLSEAVNASDRSLQRLLSEVKWDDSEVMRQYRHMMLSSTSDPSALLVVVEQVFPKKGGDSVCVSRQRIGSPGHKENCQLGVGLHYVGHRLAWPCFLELFVPPQWDLSEDEQCRRLRQKTRIPKEVRHREKWAMVIEQLEQAKAEGLPHRGVLLGDEQYGGSENLRTELLARDIPFYAAVHPRTLVFLTPPEERRQPGDASEPAFFPHQPIAIEEIAKAISANGWRRGIIHQNEDVLALVSTKTATLEVWPQSGIERRPSAQPLWLIIEHPESHARNGRFRYLFSNIPQHSLGLDSMRLAQEEEHLQGAGRLLRDLGLTHFEGRSWPGWHRHVTLVSLAFSFMALSRQAHTSQHQRQSWASWLNHRSLLGAEHFL